MTYELALLSPDWVVNGQLANAPHSRVWVLKMLSHDVPTPDEIAGAADNLNEAELRRLLLSGWDGRQTLIHDLLERDLGIHLRSAS